MTKKAILTSALLVAVIGCVPTMYAQSQPTPPETPGQMEGCLKVVRDHYELDDKNGNAMELSGAAGKLKKLVGHTVQVSGKPGTRTSDTTTQGIASSAVEIPVIYVKTVKDLSNSCE